MQKPVNKRATLPGAAELFRQTQPNPAFDTPRRAEARQDISEAAQTEVATPDVNSSDSQQVPVASGRIRHDQKITVYFSSEELFALEDATLACKRSHGLKVDRGRLVRSAVALALADLAEHGEESDVVAALRAQ
ncbi:MAG: hypothetical protein ACTHWA_00885 [Arachnia sp.]